MLVIDDNVDLAQTMSAVLGLWGHDVETAYDGLEGLERAYAFRPDVVICDLGLPELDGFAVARKLRDDRNFDHIRLIAVSGYDVPRAAMAAGFDLHLIKPADLAALATLIGDDAALTARAARMPGETPIRSVDRPGDAG